MQFLRKDPGNIKPYGRKCHLFSQDVAHKLIEEFSLGFSAPVGNICHQHLFIPESLKEEAIELLKEYGVYELSLKEHNQDRLPDRVPESDYLSILIWKRSEMIDLELNKRLIKLCKKNGDCIQFGGGYSILWKVGHLHDESRLEELLLFLEDNKLHYKLPENFVVPSFT